MSLLNLFFIFSFLSLCSYLPRLPLISWLSSFPLVSWCTCLVHSWQSKSFYKIGYFTIAGKPPPLLYRPARTLPGKEWTHCSEHQIKKTFLHISFHLQRLKLLLENSFLCQGLFNTPGGQYIHIIIYVVVLSVACVDTSKRKVFCLF